MRTSSLTRQLIGGVLIAEFICAGVFAAVAVGHEMHGRKRAFDVMLRGRADSLLGAVRDAEDPEDNVIVDPTELTLPSQDVYEVISSSGRLVGQSPSTTPTLLANLGAAHTPGYFSFEAGGEKYRALRANGMRVIDRDDKGGLRRPVTVLYASPTRGLWHEAIEAVRFYVLAGALLLAMTGVALIWFLRRRLSPLQELAAIASRVTSRSWDFAPPPGVLHTSELAPIAHSIDELLKGLRQAFERQRQLTGDAAHELKTSIAVVKSSLQLLALSPRTTEQYEAGLEGVLVDTERMEDLSARMLALARLEEAPAERSETSELLSAVHAVTERLRPFAELRQIELQVDATDSGKVGMPIDDADVLCSNLIMNAVQHSSPAGRVSTILRTEGEFAELRVVDEGDGIPETALPHVFDRFFRADRSRSRNSGGAGLGLSICKAIVERSGGTIEIKSVLGKGTQVSVSLPLLRAD